MKIAVASDCHDNFDNLDKAIEIANQKGCQYLFFAGDFVTPSGIENLQKFQGKVEMVWGNNEGEKVGFVHNVDNTSNITMHGDICEMEIEGIKIFMNHYPKLAELAAKSKEYDLVIHGHSHTYRKEKFDDALLINPGNLKGWREEAGFVIFDTKNQAIEKIGIKK